MLLFATILKSAIKAGVSLFWGKLKSWITKAVGMLVGIVNEAAAKAVRTFVVETTEGVKEMSSLFVKQGIEYIERVVYKRIDASEVPVEIRNKSSYYLNNECDITNDFEQVLVY